METESSRFPALSLAVVAMLAALHAQLPICHAQTTAFTYPGRLTSGTNAANGVYGFSFALFNAASAQQGATLATNALRMGSGAAWPQMLPPYQINGTTISVTVTNTSATGKQYFRPHKP